ncbi:hypothetical protein [Streptomyces lavendofoliae]|uniref:hypothetical protein n=1 Tax=Streptomyces lavendofoliae TaxID=67314 RepID=UPI003D910200
MRPRIPTVITALAAGALLALALPTSAGAASGHFDYTSGGIGKSLTDPVNGRCYSIAGATAVGNYTNRSATVFTGIGYTGSPALVRSGYRRSGNVESVKFS